jgi:hypothetical protein
MKKTIYILAILAALGGFGVLFSQSDITVEAQAVQHCLVSDPSGTPLNIRSTPNGKRIVGTLKNGTRVAFDTESGDGRDNSWAYIWLDKKNNKKPLGWVLRANLDCQ